MKVASLLASAVLVLSACATTSQSPDAAMSARVKQQIAQTEGIAGARSVNVQSANGVVVLTGFIDNEKQRYDAGQAALKVAGVQQVYNNIQVMNQSSGR